MNLNIIDMLYFNVMAHSDRQSIAGNMTIVCRELEQTADTAGCQNNRLCADFFQCTVCVSDNTALADICLLITDDIYQRGIFTDGNVFALSCASQQLAGDFLSGQILVEQNAVLGMCALTGEFKISVLIALKVHAVINQFLRNMLRRTNHDVHGFFVVLVMTSLHRIFEIAVIIIVIQQHAHAALCEERVCLISLRLGDDQNLVFFGQLQCVKQSGSTGTDNQNVSGFHVSLPLTFFRYS